MGDPRFPGIGRLGWVFEAIASAVIGFITVAIIVGVLVLLVRFLLVATRAAQAYVDTHEPPKPVPDPGAGGPRPDAPVPPGAAPYGGATQAPRHDEPPRDAPPSEGPPPEVAGPVHPVEVRAYERPAVDGANPASDPTRSAAVVDPSAAAPVVSPSRKARTAPEPTGPDLSSYIPSAGDPPTKAPAPRRTAPGTAGASGAVRAPRTPSPKSAARSSQASPPQEPAASPGNPAEPNPT